MSEAITGAASPGIWALALSFAARTGGRMLDNFAPARRGADQEVRKYSTKSSASKRFRQDSISAGCESGEPVAPIAIEGHPNEQKGCWTAIYSQIFRNS